MCRATQEVVFLIQPPRTLNVEQHQPTSIYEDKEGAISNANGEISSMAKRSRHVDIKCHHTREQLKKMKATQPLHIASQEQQLVVGLLTKGLDVSNSYA